MSHSTTPNTNGRKRPESAVCQRPLQERFVDQKATILIHISARGRMLPYGWAGYGHWKRSWTVASKPSTAGMTR
jgi:hypothetical protein